MSDEMNEMKKNLMNKRLAANKMMKNVMESMGGGTREFAMDRIREISKGKGKEWDEKKIADTADETILMAMIAADMEEFMHSWSEESLRTVIKIAVYMPQGLGDSGASQWITASVAAINELHRRGLEPVDTAALMAECEAFHAQYRDTLESMLLKQLLGGKD
jgi:homoserine kinase